MPSVPSVATGFTLIEVMMATALLAVVISITSAFLASMSDNVTSEMVQSDLDTRSAGRLASLAEELADGWAFDATPAPAGGAFSAWKAFVKYPADVDLDDDIMDNVMDAGGNNGWGVRGLRDVSDTRTKHAGEWPGHIEYYFEPNTSGAVLNETDLNADINGDYVKDDVFVRGWLLKKWVRTDAGAPMNPPIQRLLSGVVQREATLGGGDFGADIDEDGNPDPIFRLVGNKRLTVSLWLYSRDERGRPVLKHAETSIQLPNQQ